jgi:hypothetical protein
MNSTLSTLIFSIGAMLRQAMIVAVVSSSTGSVLPLTRLA